MLPKWAPVHAVYIACPGGFATGGTELLHQLAHALRRMGRPAFMYYYEKAELGRPPVFDCYDAPAGVPSDDPRHLIVVPEIGPHLFHRFKRATKCIWWLSVDNHYAVYGKGIDLRQRWERWRAGRSPNPWLRHRSVTHLAQSRYAIDHLRSMGLRSHALGDYLREDFLDIAEGAWPQKGDRVCFNPKKGQAFTRLLQEKAVDWEWVALSDLPPEGIRDRLLGAKLYIDFGHHPGKDRIPREAALAGCVVISGREGSAANAEDLPLGDDFKIDQRGADAPERAIAAIARALRDYPDALARQADYRRRVRLEKEEFLKGVARLFI